MDSTLQLEVKIEEDTVWLTQAQMVELFQSSKQNISLHINNIFKEGELDRNSVVKDYLTTASDGKNYRYKLYNLDVIISVGYRVDCRNKQKAEEGITDNKDSFSYSSYSYYLIFLLHQLISLIRRLHPTQIDQQRHQAADRANQISRSEIGM